METLYANARRYRSCLDLRSTQQAIQFVKRSFEKQLEHFLSLEKIEAPLFVAAESGLNDSLTGTEKAVSFEIQALPQLRAEIVHSLAKWKRMALGLGWLCFFSKKHIFEKSKAQFGNQDWNKNLIKQEFSSFSSWKYRQKNYITSQYPFYSLFYKICLQLV